MTSALSVKVVVCCVASALPMTARAQMQRPGPFDVRGPAAAATAAPLASAVTREAMRLAADRESTGVEAMQQRSKPAESNWARVRDIAPGTEVIVTVRGSQPGRRYVVLADESQLTVLNVGYPLPAAARKVLLDVASRHPAFFADGETRDEFVSEDVRVGSDGVFVADRKVADLGQVVERIARHDVAEIEAGRVHASPKRLGKWAAIPGAFLGAMIGAGVDCAISNCGSGSPNIPTGVGVGMLVGAVATVVAPRRIAGGFLGVGGGFVAGGLIGGAIEGDCRPDDRCARGVAIGAPVGAVAGGFLGYKMASRKTESVIYTAP